MKGSTGKMAAFRLHPLVVAAFVAVAAVRGRAALAADVGSDDADAGSDCEAYPPPATAPLAADRDKPTQRRDVVAAQREAYIRLTVGAGAAADVGAAHSTMLAAAVVYLTNTDDDDDALTQRGGAAAQGDPDAAFAAALGKLEEQHGARGAEKLMMDFLLSVDSLVEARGATDLALAAVAAFVAAEGRMPGGAVGVETLGKLLARVQATVPEERAVSLVRRRMHACVRACARRRLHACKLRRWPLTDACA